MALSMRRYVKKKTKAQTGFEPVIFGLRDRRLTTWPLRRWYPLAIIKQKWPVEGSRFLKKSLAAVGFEPTPPKRLVP